MPLTRTLTFERFRIERLSAGKREQALRQRGGATRAVHRLQCRALEAAGAFGKVALKRFEIADDDLEQVVEVVRDAARELPDGFHLLRLPQGLLVFPQLCGALGHLLFERDVEVAQRVLRSFALVDFALRRLRQAGVVDRDRGFRRQPGETAFGSLVEDGRRRMSEEQSTDDLAAARRDRNGQIAADRQMAFRHPLSGRIVAVAGILRDIAGPDDPLATECRREDLRVARHRKFRKGLRWRA